MRPLPSPARLKRLNRRQRKKRHVGEFQELVFSAQLTFRAPLDRQAHDTFIEAFIGMVEPRGLAIGAFGGGAMVTETDGIVMKWRSGSVSEAERLGVIQWLEGRPEVGTVVAGGLVDAHYGWDEDE
jgi:uncharacterized protein YggL (DUF469 family)